MSITEVVYGKPFFDIRLEDIGQWWVLGCRCQQCGRVSEIDRWALQRRFTKHAFVRHLADKARCRLCSNRTMNSLVIIGKLARG